jgi:uncharacterized protein (DUF58 family)
MVPTKRFWLLVGLGIPLAMLAAASDSIWLIYAYNALLLLIAYTTSKMSADPHKLKVTRRFDPVLSVRVSNRIQVNLVNDGPEPLNAVLRDEPPPSFHATERQFPLRLRPGEERELSYQITPPERGSDYFRGTYLRLACPLGLVVRQVKLNTEQPVRVYPNVLALREFDLLKQKGQLRELGIRKSRMRGLGTDFESLREYSEGDDYRKVDWKASARRGKLIVRQFEQERNQPVILCIDIGRRMLSEVNGVTKLDHVLDALLVLTHAAAVAGDFVGLLVYSDRVKRYIPPRKGRNQVGMIIEAIHDLVADPVESDPQAAFAYLATRWKRRSLIVAFSDVEAGDEAKSLAGSLGGMVHRHILLLARVADPRLKELALAPARDVPELYAKAAALFFSGERKMAGTVLDAAGVHSLEAEPQDLAAALVSFYFMVKERSLL